jgi:uncharacterized protein YndB with AHSA1/START domain
MAAQTFAWIYRIHIAVPRATVCAYVSDIRRHAEWSGAQMRIEALASEPAVGSRYRSVGKTAGLPFRSEVVITELSPPDRLAFVAHGIDGEFLHEFTFEPDEGGTLVERRISTQLPRPVGLFVKTITWPLLLDAMNVRALERLKWTLEHAPS